jgi:hypothetical protein
MVGNWPRMIMLVTAKEATPITSCGSSTGVLGWEWCPGQATGTTEAAALTISAVIIRAPTNESTIRRAFSKWVDMILFPELGAPDHPAADAKGSAGSVPG